MATFNAFEPGSFIPTSVDTGLSQAGKFTYLVPSGDDAFRPVPFLELGTLTRKTRITVVTRNHNAFEPWGQGLTNQFYQNPRIIPDPIYFGSIIADTTIAVQVYNASLLPLQITQATLFGVSGVSMVPQAAIPAVVNPLESFTLDLTASLSGPADITGTLTVVIGGQVLVVSIRGTRSVVIPQLANWGENVEEELEWLTGVETAFRGNEQRREYREFARRRMTYAIMAKTASEAAKVENRLFGNMAEFYSVPVVVDSVKLTQTALAGSDEIYFDTDYLNSAEGQNLMIRTGVNSYQSVQVQSVHDGYVVLSSPLVDDLPVGTKVYPIAVAHLGNSQTIKRQTASVLTGRLSFDFAVVEYQANLPDLPAPYLLDDLELLMMKPNWDSGIEINYTNRFLTFGDSDGGLLSYEPKGDFTVPIMNVKFFLRDEEQIKFFRGFLRRRAGRRIPFWFASQNRDFIPVANIVATTAFLVVEDNGHLDYVGASTVRSRIAIFVRGQALPIVRDISIVANNPDGTKSLQFEEQFDSDIPLSQIIKVSYLFKVRLGSDKVVLSWLSDRRVNCKLNLVTVED